jgi:hypothetical protein
MHVRQDWGHAVTIEPTKSSLSKRHGRLNFFGQLLTSLRREHRILVRLFLTIRLY